MSRKEKRPKDCRLDGEQSAGQEAGHATLRRISLGSSWLVASRGYGRDDFVQDCITRFLEKICANSRGCLKDPDSTGDPSQVEGSRRVTACGDGWQFKARVHAVVRNVMFSSLKRESFRRHAELDESSVMGADVTNDATDRDLAHVENLWQRLSPANRALLADVLLRVGQNEGIVSAFDELMEYVKDLPKNQRSVLELALQGSRNSDIANSQRLTVEAVKSRVQRARELIRKKLARLES